MKAFLKNSSGGFTLIETMVGIGMMSMLLFGVTDLGIFSSKISRSAQLKSNFLSLKGQLEAVISKPGVCKSILENNVASFIPPLVTPNSPAPVLNVQVPFAGTVLLNSGPNINQGLDLEFQITSATLPASQTCDSLQANCEFESILQVKAKPIGEAIVGSNEFTANIPLLVSTTGAAPLAHHVITDCSAQLFPEKEGDVSVVTIPTKIDIVYLKSHNNGEHCRWRYLAQFQTAFTQVWPNNPVLCTVGNCAHTTHHTDYTWQQCHFNDIMPFVRTLQMEQLIYPRLLATFPNHDILNVDFGVYRLTVPSNAVQDCGHNHAPMDAASDIQVTLRKKLSSNNNLSP